MIFFKFFTFILFIFYSIESFSIRREFKNINKDDGLPSSCVFDVLRDDEGYIWFATDRGICRFDGEHYDYFTQEDGLSDNQIFLIRKDSKGRIWLLSGNSRICFIFEGKVYNGTNTVFLAKINSVSWFVSFCEDNDGTIWIGSYLKEIFYIRPDNEVGQLFFKFNSNGASDFPLGRIISDFYVSKNNDLFFVCSEIGIVRIRNFNIFFPCKNKCSVSKSISAVILNLDTILYSDGHNIFMTDLNQNFDNSIFRSSDNIISIYRLYNGLIGVITLENILIFPISDSNKYFIKVRNNINAKRIYNDDENVFWFTSLSNGIFFVHEKFIYVDDDLKYGNHVFSVLNHFNESIIFGGDDSNLYFIDKFFSVYNSLSLERFINLGRGRIFGYFQVSKEVFFIACENMLILFENGKFIFFPVGAKAICSNGEYIFIGFSNNCYKFRIDFLLSCKRELISDNIYRVSFNPSNFSILPGVRVSSLAIIENHLFVGSSRGLFRIGIYDDSLEEYCNLHDQSFCGSIQSITSLNNKFLILGSSNFGLAVCDKSGNLIHPIFSNFLGLEFKRIVISPTLENIWLCTDKGLFSFNVDCITSSNIKLDIVQFTTKDGLLSDEVNDITYGNGKWWVATDKGISIFDENYFDTRREKAPQLISRSFLVNGSGTGDDDNKEWVEGSTRVAFSLGCLSFRHFRNIRFRYKLRPTDYWHYTLDYDHKISNLGRGDYRIEVQARSPFSPWSKSVYFPAFTVLPPWWERPWVQYTLFFAMVSFLALIGSFLYKMRVNQIAIRNQMMDANLKALRAQIKPHFLSNILHSVQAFFSTNQGSDAILLLGNFGKLMRRILDNSDRDTIPILDEMDQIRDYLNFECKRTRKNIDFEIRMASDFHFYEVYIPTMLIQPLIENCIVHGLNAASEKPGRIWIDVVAVDPVGSHPSQDGLSISRQGRLLISVSDNGIGREASALKRKLHSNSKSHGMKSLDGKLKWFSYKFNSPAFYMVLDLSDSQGNPSGTRVTLNLPLIFRDPIDEITSMNPS